MSFKEAEMAADVGTLQSNACVFRPIILMLLLMVHGRDKKKKD